MIDKFAKLSPKQKVLVIGLLGVFIIFPIFMGIKTLQFRVVASDPAQGSKTNVYGVVILTYNRAISADEAVIKTEPVFAYTKRVDDNKLIITPTDNLQHKTTYRVTVENVCEKTNLSKCVDFTLNYSVDNTIPFSALSEEQKSRIIGQTDAEFEESPILSVLPVRQENFLIDQRMVETSRFVVITPNIAASGFTEEEYKALYSKYYQEGRKYLQDLGYALESDNYKVVSQAEFNTLVAGDE